MNRKSEFDFTHTQVCASSQDLAYELARKIGRAHLVLCDEQSAGRGRRGNKWQSAGNHSLACSLAIPMKELAKIAHLLPHIASVALWSALQKNNPALSALCFKWPNDLGLYGSNPRDESAGFRKVAGILVEIRQGIAIVGWGVNLAAPAPFEGALALDEIAQVRKTAPAEWANAIAGEFLFFIREARRSPLSFEDKLIEFLSNRLMRRMFGREISATWGNGLVRGLAKSASLLVENADRGVFEVTSGEVGLL